MFNTQFWNGIVCVEPVSNFLPNNYDIRLIICIFAGSPGR